MGWHFIHYIIHFVYARLKARCSVPSSQRKITFSTGDWKYEIGEGREKNEFDALALVVQEDFLLRQLCQRRNILPLQKDTLDLASCNCLLTSRRKISYSFPTTYIRMYSLIKRMHNDCQGERVSYQYHITIRAWYHIAIHVESRYQRVVSISHYSSTIVIRNATVLNSKIIIGILFFSYVIEFIIKNE